MANTRKGLVVSCSYPRSDHELEAPENDALFYERLLKNFGFSVRRLSDLKLGLQSSHRGNILRSVEWLIQDAKRGDNLAFVFSGHGLCTTCTSSERRDELDRALLAAELEEPFPANLLFDSELQSLFGLLPAGVLVTCIIDAPCGDRVLRLPWYYDAKTRSFCGPPRARHSSLWLGDRKRQQKDHRGRSDFTIRGAPTSLAKPSAAKPHSGPHGPCDFFPGVAAFLLCACRPDQVCLEAKLPACKQSYGLFTTSFAAALQQAVHTNVAGRQGEPHELALAGLSYLQLAKLLDDELQKRMKVIAGRAGVEQHILLGFSQDPSTSAFLQPPHEVWQVPRPLKPPGCHNIPASVLANLMAGCGGEPRWPNVLVQLCRVDRDELMAQGSTPDNELHLNRSLLTAEVLGEFWLPPLAHMFPQAGLPGDPPATPKPPASRAYVRSPRSLRSPRPGKPCSKIYHARKELRCRLREPAVGAHQQYCTWGAALRCGQFQSWQLQATDDGNAFPKGCDQHTKVATGCMRLADLLAGAMGSRSRYADAARKLRWRGGAMTALEFEYFAVRELGLDLATAQKAFASSVEAQAQAQAKNLVLLTSPLDSIDVTMLAKALEDCAQDSADPGFVLEARLELDWQSVGLAGANAGELRLFAAELQPRELPKDPVLVQLNAREAELGYGTCGYSAPGGMATLNRVPPAHSSRPHTPRTINLACAEETSTLSGEDGSLLFLRFGLCASRDVYPNATGVTPRGMLVTPRLNAPEASWIVPHIVFVSSALVYARLPGTGAWCARMPLQEDVGGFVVPVCTCERLCHAQRAAFSLPCEPPSKLTPEPPPTARTRRCVAPIPEMGAEKGRPLVRSSSDSTLPCSS